MPAASAPPSRAPQARVGDEKQTLDPLERGAAALRKQD
jgi:hypothetical protein